MQWFYFILGTFISLCGIIYFVAIKRKWSLYTNSPLYVSAKRKDMVDFTEIVEALALILVGLLFILASFYSQQISISIW